MAAGEQELRCGLCSFNPLLATYGSDKDGLYLHVKIWKQKRIYGEIYAEVGSTLRILCRDCFRWHRVTIPEAGRVALMEVV